MNYRVQPGDTPGTIAQRFTGDATRAPELIAYNPFKRRVITQNGVTFYALRVGEMLNMPPTWQVAWGNCPWPSQWVWDYSTQAWVCSGGKPSDLPFPVAGQPMTLKGMPYGVGKLAMLGQNVNVPGPITAGQSTVISATGLADGDINWTSSLGATIDPNPSTSSSGSTSINYTSSGAGTDTLTATDSNGTSASAQVAVVAVAPPPPPGTTNPALTDPSVVAAATAMNQVADFTSSAACGPVQTFQSAWNAAGGSPTLSVDGGYGPNTAAANAQVAAANGGGNVLAALTSGFPSCGVSPPSPVPVPPMPVPVAPPVAPPSTSSTNVWPWVIAGVVVAGGAVALAMASKKKRAAPAHRRLAHR
jgi:hypothetical protein